MKSIKKRALSFWKSDSPLTSRRVSIILSNSRDSDSLANLIRNNRNLDSETKSFKVSSESEEKIKIEFQ